jgi:hypothetical protein
MALTATQSKSMYQFFALAFDAAPGVTYMNQLDAAINSGMSVTEVVEAFTSKAEFTSSYPSFLTNEAFATKFINTNVGSYATDAAKTAAINDIAAALNAGWSRGKTITQVFTNITNLADTDATWGNVVKLVNNQVAYAQYYTETLLGGTEATPNLATLRAVIANVTPTTSVVVADMAAVLNPAPVPVAQTFTLTAGLLDGLIYSGTSSSVDSLTATVTNADDNGAAVTMSEIENMTVRVSGVGGVELVMSDASGIETFTANRLGSTLTLTDGTDLGMDLVISNQSTAAILDVDYEASTISGDADEVNLSVNRSTDAEADLDGVEVVNLTSTNASADAANVLDLSGADMETVNVTADADLTLAVDNAAEVNVSGAGDVAVTLAATTDSTVTSTGTGALTVNANGAADLTLTGSTGADTFAMGTTLTADDVIDGGDGGDTLRVTGAAGAVIPADAQISNVETLRVTTGGADTFNASIASFDSVTVVSAADAHSFAATAVTTETISITHADNAGAGVTDIAGVNINLAVATGTADSLTISITNADATTAFTVGEVDSSGNDVETINLILNQGVDIADGSDIIIGDVEATAYDALTVSGAADATFGTGTAVTIADIDASAATGDLVFELGAATTDITTGSGDDTIDFNGNLTSADTADGGVGDDTLTAVVAASQVTQATISNVETISLDFANAGSTFSARNVTGATALTLQGAAAHRITNLAAQVATVNLIEEAQDEVVTIAYAAGSAAAHTLNFTEVTAGATETYGTVTVSGNAGAFSIINDAIFAVTSITNNAASSLAITTAALLDLDNNGIALQATAAAAVTITTNGGNFAVSDAAGTVDVQEAESIALNALDGSIVIEAELLADGTDVDVNLTASGADANDIRVDLLTVTNLSTLTATASGGADITLADIVYSGDDAAGDDTVVTFNLNASGDGSTITVSDLSVAATVVLDSVVITTSDDGVVSFTSTDTDAIITSINASAAAADALVIDVASLAAATTITLGAGTSTVTTSGQGDTINVGTGEATLNLTDGATEVNMSGGDATINQLGGTAVLNLAAGVETINIAAADATEINGFDVENDIFVLGQAALVAIDTSTLVDGNSDAIVVDGVARSAIIIDDVTTGGADFAMDTASSVLRLSGAFADIAAVDAELLANLDSAGFSDGDGIVVIWSDGANAHISYVVLDDVLDAGAADDAVDAVTVNDLAVLVGMAHTDITAASLGDFFAA